ADTGAFYIGQRGNNSDYASGLLDEIRVSTVIRSADWLDAVFNTVFSNDVFTCVGAVSNMVVPRPACLPVMGPNPNCLDTTCSGNFYDSGGAGGSYGDNEDLSQTICAVTGQVVVTFSAFETELGNDILTIYDGADTNAPLVGAFSGVNSPGSVTSSTGCLTFHFFSDGANSTGAGWAASISCLTSCMIPAPAPSFSITNAWSSTENARTAVAPLVGDMDGDTIPDILVAVDSPSTGFRLYQGHGSNAASAVVDFPIAGADTGTILRPAIADVDGDGFGELIVNLSSGLFRVYEHDGTLKYSSAFGTFTNGAPNVTDLNEDGDPEIVIGNGVYNGQTGAEIIAHNFGSPFGVADGGAADPVAVDILPTAFCADCGAKEIMAGSAVYSINVGTGTRIIQNTQIAAPFGDGPTAVADLDLDGDLDAAYVNIDGTFYIWDVQTSFTMLQHSNFVVAGVQGLPLIAKVYDDTPDGHALDLPDVIVETGGRL
ncbi:MAG: FG-GAP-like repeat-containing protein, partial [Verrucomicrobiota bacterium]